jgi:hypothetical protein
MRVSLEANNTVYDYGRLRTPIALRDRTVTVHASIHHAHAFVQAGVR